MTAQATAADLILVEQRVTNEGPSVGVAYALWFFLGLLSGHRFYLKRSGSALLQIASYLFLIGFAWWLLDAFAIPGMIAEDRQKLRDRFLAQRTPAPTALEPPAPLTAPIAASSSADQLSKLWALKEAGALSEAEFERQKALVLGAPAHEG